jgi:drug/metabolite transporter (DMT)-like permease
MKRIFDIRTIIGGLFGLYGIILTVAGLFTDSSDLRKAEDIRINLWTGLAMLVVSAIFLTWVFLRPLRSPSPDA